MHVIETGAGRRYKVRWREGGRNRARHFERAGDARAFDAEMRRHGQTRGMNIVASNLTVDEYAETWLRGKARTTSDRTPDVYAVQLDLRISPMLGGYRLTEVTPPIVRDFIARMQKAGTGDPTIVKTCTVLQSMFRQAVEDGLVDRNPVVGVKKPSQRRTRVPDVVPPRIVEAIRAQLEPRDATLVSVLAYAGLRPESEAVTLTWSQVGERTLAIPASAKRGGRDRHIPILAPLAEDLAAWRGQTRGRSLVFPHGPGGWSRDDWRNWLRRVYKPAAVTAGLPSTTRARDLRGSFASLLIFSGLNVVEVAQQLGHSPSMCLDTYAGVFAEFDPEQRQSPEAVIAEARA